jgi:hypothetical protein
MPVKNKCFLGFLFWGSCPLIDPKSNASVGEAGIGLPPLPVWHDEVKIVLDPLALSSPPVYQD